MLVTFEFKWLDQFSEWKFDYWHLPSQGAEEIAAWLDNDIQWNGGADQMIERLRGIQEGKEKKGYIGGGNAHRIYAFDDYLFLECQFAEDLKVILPIEEAIKALEGFARFKSGDYKSPDYQPEPFTVTYDYEGAEAEARYEETGLPWGLTEEEFAEKMDRINALNKKQKK